MFFSRIFSFFAYNMFSNNIVYVVVGSDGDTVVGFPTQSYLHEHEI